MTRKIDLEDSEIVLLCKALQSKINNVKKWLKTDQKNPNPFYYQKDLKVLEDYQKLLGRLVKELPEGTFKIKEKKDL